MQQDQQKWVKPPVRKFTLEERRKLQQLIEKGHSRNDIAEFLGRHVKSLTKEVAACVKMHGRYDAELAHELKTKKRNGPSPRHLSLEQISLIKEGLERGLTLHATAALARTHRRKVKQYADTHGYTVISAALSNKTMSGPDAVSFEQRILFLEEQVKILSETIKELLCQK